VACLQYGQNLSPDAVRWVAVVFQLGIVAVLAPAISSGAITDELTSRTFLMMRMTPISAVTVVLGKLKAGFLYVCIFLASSLPVLLALAYLDTFGADEVTLADYWRVGVWLLIMIAATLVFIAGGFCASAFSRNTSGATAVSYCFAAAICIVTFVALIPGAVGTETGRMLLTLNPVAVALRVTSDQLFPQLGEAAWQHNLAAMLGITLALIVISSLRVYHIFTRRA